MPSEPRRSHTLTVLVCFAFPNMLFSLVTFRSQVGSVAQGYCTQPLLSSSGIESRRDTAHATPGETHFAPSFPRHPRLPARAAPFPGFGITLTIDGVPGFESDRLELSMDPTGVSAVTVEQARRTFELSRQVEFAAIAVAGLGLHVAGGHEMIDVTPRGSGADGLEDAARHFLEIARRSRRRDLETAWTQKAPCSRKRPATAKVRDVLSSRPPTWNRCWRTTTTRRANRS